MKKINKFIEIKLADLGGVIAAYPLRFILAVLVVVVLIASNLPKITVDTSTEGFLHETSQSRLDYDAFRNQFGRDEKVWLPLKRKAFFS